MIGLIRVLCALFVLAILGGGLHAQVPTGTPPLASFGGGPDVIDLANLNSHITVPVLHKPGRGLNFDYDMSYDTSVWYPVGASGSQVWMPVFNWGWRGTTEVATGYVSNFQQTVLCFTTVNGVRQVSGSDDIQSNWAYHDPFGTSHNFSLTTRRVVGTGCGISSTPQQNVQATDGSGLTLSAGPSGDAVFTNAGKNLNVTNLVNNASTAGSATDRNGNQISVTNAGVFTDTLGTTVLSVAGSGTPSSPTTFTYTAPNGKPAAFTMKFTTYSVRTNFGCSGITDYGTNGTTTAPLVSEIDLPDGSKYTFSYEPTPGFSGFVTGRLASVKLPTGGTISYTYTGGTSGINCADGSAATLTRATPDGTWTYAQVKGSGAASTTTVTDPQNNQTVLQFQGTYETERQSYQGSVSPSNLLRTLYTCYNTSAFPCNTTTIALPITQRNMTTVLPGSANLTSQHVYKYNSSGSLIEQDDYDYGNGAVGALLKKTAIGYNTFNNNILSFRQQVTVTNGAGTVVSQVNYNYDQGTVAPSSGTPQHISVTGSRGNLTSTNYYTQGSTALTNSMTYFDTGTLQSATDVNGAVTTYNYPDATSTCGNAFATSVSEPLSLSRSVTWNCTGGVQTSTKDENGNTSSISYTTDPNFWRPESVTDALGNPSALTYAPNANSSSFETASSLTFNNGNSQTGGMKFLDSLGRTYVEQHAQTPNSTTFDSVSFTFDSSGRPSSTSMPCSIGSAGRCSTAKTITSYDGLGRVAQITDGGGGTITNSFNQNDVLVVRGPQPTGENSKQHQSEYDALGRLTSICEITSAVGSGSCAQNTSKTGFWTKYSYDPLGRLTGVTQNAQASSGTQSRTYVYDLMGRMTSETNPENGTTAYVYDTDATCGTSKGDLVKRTDAVGNVTCFSYDSLHRQLSVTYPSGSYAANTPNKYFVYDSATVNQVAMANGKGRLVEAYTAANQSGTKITDIGNSYTVRGEASDVYESTPNSGGYYHVAETYWANGALNTLVGPSPLPTFTLTPDGEGRISAVSASSGQNPLTSVSYNSASLPTVLTYGSTDSDAFSYDSNINRMTKYQFNVNGQSLTGTLTWNANSTLQTLAITDALNSADTQTCNYLYDDLVRLNSANCGSVWSQTFSYDVFGNISKSGSATFAASYNPATNRISSVGGFTPTYDANGNTLTDPVHTYSWNSGGKPVSIDSVNMTYDALGRMVEQNRSGTFTQFVYGPNGGKFAIMSGQTLEKAMVPLPGGGVAVYGPSGLLYYGHSDHLGSIRLGSTSTRTVSFDLAYAPFGETYALSGGSTDPAFTGQRQDTVSGLFDFPAREYSNEGRWSSPDPSGLASTYLTDPQSFNRYAYVRNTPMSLFDPSGLGLRRPIALIGPNSCDPCQEINNGGGGGGYGDFYGDEFDIIMLNGGDPGNGVDPGSNPGIGNQPSQGPASNSGNNCGADDPACLGNGLPGGLDPSTVLQNEPQWGSTPPGPGTEYSSFNDAGGFATIYDYWANEAAGSEEWVNEIYQNADGTYSFDVGRPGVPGAPSIDPGAIPQGTDFAGWAHTHGDDGLPTFSNVDSRSNNTFSLSGTYPQYQGMFVSTPDNSIQGRTNTNVSFIICTKCAGTISPP